MEEEKGGVALRSGLRAAPPPEAQLRVVDYLSVPKYRHGSGEQGRQGSLPPR